VEGEQADEPTSLRLPKRRIWPFLIAAVLVFGGGCALLYKFLDRPDPMTVLVAVELDGGWWEGSKASALIADGVAADLEKVGFTPLKSGDPKITAALEKAKSPIDAAKRVGAAFVILGKLKPEIIQHPVESGYVETRLEGKIQIAYAGEAPVDAGTVSSWSGAKVKEQALDLLAESLADKTFDVALPIMMKHPALKALTSGAAADQARVSLAKAYVELREKKLAEAEKTYAAVPEERKKEERGRRELKYIGKFDRAAALAGISKKGLLIHADRVKPFFSPISNELTYYHELERIFWLSPNGEETDVYRGYNVYGYPGSDREGNRVVLIEDIFGWARAATLVDGNAPPKRLMVEPGRWLSEPAVSPDGSAVAMWDRKCERCPARLLVLSLPDGKPRYAGADGESALGGFTWAGPGRLVFLDRPPPKSEKEEENDLGEKKLGEHRLMELDVSKEPAVPELLQKAVAEESYGPPSASADGRYIALSRYTTETISLALFDRNEKKLSVYDIAWRVDRPALSPDGTRVAFERGGDIAVFTFEGAKTIRLTENPFSERYPVFALDGKSVLFESRSKDPNFSKRNISGVGSVELP